ncbi:MAG: signal recognition particle-docking protein FtsY [Bordetella sp.]|nr:MAG: signal recognition particle-docking protein FtsY [Bordetella sp.]
MFKLFKKKNYSYADQKKSLDKSRNNISESLTESVNKTESSSIKVESLQDTHNKNIEDYIEKNSNSNDIKKFWFSRLKNRLSNTGKNLGNLFKNPDFTINDILFDELESALIISDVGISATNLLLSSLKKEIKTEKITDPLIIKKILRISIENYLRPLEKKFSFSKNKLLVITITGVNGVGKTTSIGKLAHYFQSRGNRVLFASCDTFRAAAKEQLSAWAKFNNVDIIFQNENKGNPSSVAFEAVNFAKNKGIEIVLIDTAGRLPTQPHLMEEIKKINRAVKKVSNDICQEVFLVIDGNTGQNAISQIQIFNTIIGLTGLIITKLDGTVKGGILLSLVTCNKGFDPIPVYWIGIGEKLKDLQPFSAKAFADALIS